MSDRSLEEGDWIARQFFLWTTFECRRKSMPRTMRITFVCSRCIGIDTLIRCWELGFAAWERFSLPQTKLNAAVVASLELADKTT
jgi:hypothetical protein